MAIDRRRFLQATAGASLSLSGASWLAACAGPGRLAPQPGSGAFRHGVASGDPLADRVVLWTRVTPERDEPVLVDWQLARDPQLRDEVARGCVTTGAARDWTLKVDPVGLEPGATYYYRFGALGEASPVGRTRTLPLGGLERLRLAFTSCSNIAFGYFNVYALIARRADLDAVLHLGDYIYEYANETYGDGRPFDRVPEPDAELLTLVDYRARHAQYKRDPDLQEVHRQHPFISVWDDHESANNAWKGGAQNHQAGEGDWAQRRAGAMRAYLEWMPIRELPADPSGRIYRSFRFGDLADLLMLDTRLVGRDRQVRREDAAALADPARSILGPAQEAWLQEELAASQGAGVAWRVLGQQVILSPLVHRERGLIRNPDAWDGYPRSRERLLDHLERRGIGDVVVLTGDVHSSWALDVSRDPYSPAAYDPRSGRGALAVELVTPGVSSPSSVGRDPERARRAAARAMEEHPHLHWVDLVHRGYVVLDLDHERAHADWWFAESVTERRVAERFGNAFATPRGQAHLEPIPEPTPTRPDPPAPAP